jgi:Protein of unknown function (DUF4089)
VVYVRVAFRTWCYDEDLRNKPQRTQREEGREMEDKKFDMKMYVEQMALLVDLNLRDEYKDGVIANFERIKFIAKVVNEFELPEDVQVAPVFEP